MYRTYMLILFDKFMNGKILQVSVRTPAIFIRFVFVLEKLCGVLYIEINGYCLTNGEGWI